MPPGPSPPPYLTWGPNNDQPGPSCPLSCLQDWANYKSWLVDVRKWEVEEAYRAGDLALWLDRSRQLMYYVEDLDSYRKIVAAAKWANAIQPEKLTEDIEPEMLLEAPIEPEKLTEDVKPESNQSLPQIIDQFPDPFDLSENGSDPSQYQSSVQVIAQPPSPSKYGIRMPESPFDELIAGLIKTLLREPPRNAAKT